MSTMNTLICQEPKKLVWKEREIPIPGESEALIKIKSVGICGTDLHILQVPPAHPAKRGIIQGHEFTGEIVEVGSLASRRFKVGDKVTGDCVMACGVCPTCKDGRMPSACENMREIGFRPDSPGGFGEYMVVEEQQEVVVPTPVGVNRKVLDRTFTKERGPHARGGEPETTKKYDESREWSPRPWG